MWEHEHNVGFPLKKDFTQPSTLHSFMNTTQPLIGCQIVTLQSESRPSGGGERVIMTHYHQAAHTYEQVLLKEQHTVCTQLCVHVCVRAQ